MISGHVITPACQKGNLQMTPYEHLIAVTDRTLCRGDFGTQLKKVTALHPCALILRERNLDDPEYQELAGRVQEMCRLRGVPFYVHARVDVARKIGCRNIHLPLPLLRSLGGRPKGFDSVSVSCHSAEDMREAVAAGADRIILGTIFQTECKIGLRGRGLSFVKEICEACPVPVYAIGGIKETNLGDVMAAGAAGGCMMSGYMRI